MNVDNIFYKHRDFRSIGIWKDVTDEQWNDPHWQLRNSIFTVEKLKKVIILNEYQENEIQRTLETL